MVTLVSVHDGSVQSVGLISRYVSSGTDHLSYLQMCGMVPGGMIEADSRLRAYEQRIRMERRIMGDRARRQRFEEEYIKGDGK